MDELIALLRDRAGDAGGDKLLEDAAAALEAAREIEALRMALHEWLDKTEWVQHTVRPRELGKHRADVLRERIEELEDQLESMNYEFREAMERHHE